MRMNRAYRYLSPTDADSNPAIDVLSIAAVCFITQPVDAAISDMLAQIGQTLSVDRSWMFEYDTDLTRFRNTHEWCARGITSHVMDLQDAPVSMIGWLHRDLLAGKAVMIDDVSALPASASALRREMLRQGDKSVLSVPVFHGDRLRACIGFDAVHAARDWTDAEARLLAACGQMLAAARYGRHTGNAQTSSKDLDAPLIYVGRGGTVRGVTLPQIAGVRSDRNFTQVWLSNGSCLSDRRTLEAWRTLLSPATFPSIHRTAIVNLIHVAGINKHAGAGFHWQVRVRGIEQEWPVSRRHRNNLVGRLGL